MSRRALRILGHRWTQIHMDERLTSEGAPRRLARCACLARGRARAASAGRSNLGLLHGLQGAQMIGIDARLLQLAPAGGQSNLNRRTVLGCRVSRFAGILTSRPRVPTDVSFACLRLQRTPGDEPTKPDARQPSRGHLCADGRRAWGCGPSENRRRGGIYFREARRLSSRVEEAQNWE